MVDGLRQHLLVSLGLGKDFGGLEAEINVSHGFREYVYMFLKDLGRLEAANIDVP